MFRRARVAQWWERSPPTNVARVQLPELTPYVAWVCCWFSPLLREVFLRVLQFSPLLKNQHFQIPIRSGTHEHVYTSSYEPNSNYNLRQADFSIPRYETVTYGKHSIRYLGPRLWTKLPKSIRDVTTLMSFKSKVRQLNISELLDDGCAGSSLCSFWLLYVFTINLVIR